METLLDKIIKVVERSERIAKRKAKRIERKNILINNNKYIEDFNETTVDKNGKIKVKKSNVKTN